MGTRAKRIVVMGGSFNPPTLAHYKLMKAAIDALDADYGFFVPVSDAYLRRKMRNSHPPVILSPEMRIKMLRSMCDDSRMSVCEKEIGTVAARTVDTLEELQKEYPEYELYFLMGDDKLKLLIHLTEKGEFLQRFKVVLYSREESSIEETLRSNGVLSDYMNNIVILPQPGGVEGISSSAVRDKMLNGKSADGMLYPGVWEMFRNLSKEDFPDMINKFSGEYDFLKNSYGCKFEWRGKKYNTVDAAFLACEVADSSESLEIMESILIAKFNQNPGLMRRLKETGNTVLVNGNNKQETFWGVDLYSWQGENNLGKILMKIRDKEERK